MELQQAVSWFAALDPTVVLAIICGLIALTLVLLARALREADSDRP
ncbi:hypothetical protein [Burkholderia sp. Bp8963]|nr:hypothetical protein [Burkholderia sp. Bp8963]